MLILQNAFVPKIELEDITLSSLVVDNKTAKFDLTLEAYENDSGLFTIFEYNTDLFYHSTIVRMADNFLTLLESIVNNPKEHISKLSLISQAEKEKLLYTWNNTYCDYDREITIHQLFEHQVTKSPSSTAIIFEDKELSYKELNEKANQLAHFLRKLGVTADSRVGLLIERSSEMMIALLAILKAGAAYVPLDSSYPKDRISYMIDDAQLSVLITQNSLSSLASLYIGNTVFIDNDWKDIEKESTSNLVNINTSENLAYIIYTSGSTGKPKGVMISHRNVINFFVGMEQRIGKYSDGVWLAVTSISFDISVLELFWTLSRGFKVVIQSDSRGVVSSTLSEADYSITEQIKRHKVSHLQCTPSLARVLTTEEEAKEAIKELKMMMVGGEALTTSLAKELINVIKGELHNMYGPTETTIWSSTIK
ncbi:MAG: AMP-binding protein [Blastocatellia bacterium]|nr:AMP-binding protein [Blastocatellia bacterium]